MPYPGEHAARLKAPSRYNEKVSEASAAGDRFRAEARDLGDGRWASITAVAGDYLQAVEPGEQEESPDPDLLLARFRFMSADVELEGHYIVFPEDVLQEALPFWQPTIDTQGKAVNLPVKANHERDTRNLAGQVLDAEWADAVGETPPGIEGTIEFDRQLDAKMVRAVERGIQRSASSVIDHEWVPSHPELELFEFFSLLGREVNGERVQRIATKILAVHAVDMVDRGADPFSRRLDASAGSLSPIPGSPPEQQDQEDTMEWRAHLCAILGLPDSIEDSELRPELTTRLAAAKTVEALETFQARVYAACGLEAAAQDLAHVEAAVMSWRQDYVPRAELEALKTKMADERKERLLLAAVADGRITSAETKPLGEAMSEEALKLYLDTRAKGSAVPQGEQAGARAGDETPAADTLTAQQKDVAKQLGLTEAQMLAAN